jgi:hypothetical protein
LSDRMMVGCYCYVVIDMIHTGMAHNQLGFMCVDEFSGVTAMFQYLKW